MKHFIKWATIGLCLLLITGCAFRRFQQDGPPKRHVDFAKIPNAVPKALPESRYGNPPSYTVDGKTYHVLKSAKGFNKRGIASWYGTKFNGRLTSTREPYNLFAMTAAMKTVPLPSFAEVTNLKNGRHVIVKVDDRGPFADNRIIDLSYAAAGKLGMLKKGTALVDVKIINPRKWNKKDQDKVLNLQPRLKDPNHPEIYIQVGAFVNKQHAERELHDIHKSILQPSFIEISHAHKHEFYKVQIGPLKSVSSSDLVTKRLLALGYKQPLTLIK